MDTYVHTYIHPIECHLVQCLSDTSAVCGACVQCMFLLLTRWGVAECSQEVKAEGEVAQSG